MGAIDGTPDGIEVGCADGCPDGCADGNTLGWTDRKKLGPPLGGADGASVEFEARIGQRDVKKTKAR